MLQLGEFEGGMDWVVVHGHGGRGREDSLGVLLEGAKPGKGIIFEM